MWQLRLHCNLRPPDVAPVLLRLNYEPIQSLKSAKVSVADLKRFFTADTLRYAVTMISDFEGL